MRVPCCLVTSCRRVDFENSFHKPGENRIAPYCDIVMWKNNRRNCTPSSVQDWISESLLMKTHQKVKHSCYRWAIWIVLPSMTKFKPLLDIWLILFLGSRSPRLDDDIGSLAWNASLFERSPESLQAISRSWLLKGWSALLWDCVRRVLEDGRIRRLSVSR